MYRQSRRGGVEIRVSNDSKRVSNDHASLGISTKSAIRPRIKMEVVLFKPMTADEKSALGDILKSLTAEDSEKARQIFIRQADEKYDRQFLRQANFETTIERECWRCYR